MEKYKKIYDDYFTDNLPKNARYIFLPHAGYQYSGFASWCALAKVPWSKIKRVVLLTTSHFIPYSMNGIRITDERYPNIIIDGYSSTGSELPNMTPEQFNKEHSWQYLLPLFQSFCTPRSKLHIQIICIRDSLPERIERVIQTDMESQKNKNTILVGNSDLSHLNGHFTDKVHWIKDIMNQDYKTLNSLLSQSSPENVSTSACGIGVIRVFLNIIRSLKLTPRLMCYYNCCQTNLINYLSSSSSTSNGLESTLFANPDQELDTNQGCVGYGSIIYYANGRTVYPGNFSAYEQYYMTHICRYYLLNKTFQPAILPIPELIVQQHQYDMGIGIFVTLTNKINNELMGCIGTLQPINGTLLDAIYYYTDQAAYHDSRFTTRINTPTEILKMGVEITLLFLNIILPYSENMKDRGLKLVSSSTGKQAFFLPSVREMLVKRSSIRPINHRKINEELIRMLRHKGNIREDEPVELYLIPTKRLRGL
jgi:AmmeMemoRadiSam system protein B